MAPPPPPNGGSEMSALISTEFSSSYTGPKKCQPGGEWYEACKNPSPGVSPDCKKFDQVCEKHVPIPEYVELFLMISLIIILFKLNFLSNSSRE